MTFGDNEEGRHLGDNDAEAGLAVAVVVVVVVVIVVVIAAFVGFVEAADIVKVEMVSNVSSSLVEFGFVDSPKKSGKTGEGRERVKEETVEEKGSFSAGICTDVEEKSFDSSSFTSCSSASLQSSFFSSSLSL